MESLGYAKCHWCKTEGWNFDVPDGVGGPLCEKCVWPGAIEPRSSTVIEQYKKRKTTSASGYDDTTITIQKRYKVRARDRLLGQNHGETIPDHNTQSHKWGMKVERGERSCGATITQPKLSLVAKQLLLSLRCHYVKGEVHYMKERIYFVAAKSLGEPRRRSNEWKFIRPAAS